MSKTVEETCNELREVISRIDERQKMILDDLRDMHEKLFGNGKEGLCVIVDRHDTTLRNIRYGIAMGFSIVSLIVIVVNTFF